MTTTQWPPKVQPARLAFLAIYNPSLGPSDDTFADQLVFWYSRAAHDARVAARKRGKNEAKVEAAAREDENERLRQIGLAQGMVDFAKSFSDGEPVDAIETEKSRIVLHELEQGWWILASIDLTRLPSITHPPAENSKKGFEKVESKPAIEYSAREVSPPALLTQQLLQAHYIFLLHHGPSLDELYVRLKRDKFCSTLDRFWNRFSRTWDVLLHGNPAADVFSGLKLASGGELGFGVGEEEWGSGEREVLEDLTRRTEGLIDLVVSRFGEPAHAIASDDATLPEGEALPWMGSGAQPAASDGIIFGGVGALGRPSLRDISLWMRQIYTYGEYAYGVRDNPLRERRKRRRRNPPPRETKQANGSAHTPRASRDIDPNDIRQRVQRIEAARQQEDDPIDSSLLLEDKRPQIYGRTASHDHAASSAEHTPPVEMSDHPGIPPPIVSAANDALEKATQKAEQEAEQEHKEDEEQAVSGTTMGIPDTYMKYLTLGLSELAKPSKPAKPKRPPVTKKASEASASSEMTIRPPQKSNAKNNSAKSIPTHDLDDDGPMLTHLEPMPDGETLKSKIAFQKRQENKGHFVIGLKGDLDAAPDDEEAEEADTTDGGFHLDNGGTRTVLRTLQVELRQREPHVDDEESLPNALSRKERELDSERERLSNVERVRVLVYVHRPFIYTFLFSNRSENLHLSGFYRELHRTLLPIRRPLLSSTSEAKVAQRIEASHDGADVDTASVRSAGTNNLPHKGKSANSQTRPIYDLLYDPRLLTVHTSIPNIPEPGTLAAEGIVSASASSGSGAAGTPAGWTRIEALNVHSTILNTLSSVRTRSWEMERTSKTSRGWWVVWMRFPPSAPSLAFEGADTVERGRERYREGSAFVEGAQQPESSFHTQRPTSTVRKEMDMHRTAFLVRKSTDALPASSSGSYLASSGSGIASGMWNTLTLRGGPSTEKREASGSTAGLMGGGVGIDARRYVEGLLSLNR